MRRQLIMTSRSQGLTKTYNDFHATTETLAEILELREMHIAVDRAVTAAYGWTDLDLGHDFHETPQGIRFTISPAARQEVLDRLLELNHQRYREEVEQGLHDEANGRRKTSGRKRGRAAATSSPLLEGV